jgi:predicted transcriptional regulator
MPATTSVSAKIPKELRERIDEIARLERRTPSNVVRMAIEQFVTQYTELHPQFRADILEALEQMKAGDVVPYERG